MRKINRASRVVCRANQAVFESLEGRRMLSVSLNHRGTLNVAGTGHDDVITVSIDSSNSSMIDVDINGTTAQFDSALVKGVRVNSLGGNDDVTVGSTVVTPATVNGGGGDDSLSAGGGEDSLLGNGGDDSLEGGAGKSTMLGGGGDDKIVGGSGDASVDGGGGDDSITGGAGNETLNGGTGDDTLINGTGEDHIDGGRGRDHVNFNPTAGVALSTLPTAVQTGLTTLALGATIGNVVTFQTNGQTYYGTLVTINSVPTRIVVDANGNPVSQGDKGQGSSGEHDKGGFGLVTAVDASANTITVNVFSEHHTMTKTTFKVTSATTISADGEAVALGNLAAGALVNVQTTATDLTTATSITALNRRVEGTVNSIDTTANTITVTGEGGTPTTYTLNAKATVEANDVASTLSAITVSSRVEMRLSAIDGTVLDIHVGQSNGGGGGQETEPTEAHGTVASVDTSAGTVTVTNASAAQTVYTVTSTTGIYVNGAPGTLSAVAAGDEIELKIAADGTTVIALQAHSEDGNNPGPGPVINHIVIGKITAVSSSSISLQGKHDVNATIAIDSATKVTIDGAPSTVSALTVGLNALVTTSADGSLAVTIAGQSQH